ncbi:MAG: polyprenyl synthetase family protein, partial [Nitrospirae bacterium]|nr:polyprenyl synthetase family protein [Nitrospirota bacterium]
SAVLSPGFPGAVPDELFDAMRYSLLGGGKRVRPILALAAAEAVGGETEPVLPAAAAIEMIHTYSLIHDDLPAMDDDAFRRGRPTNHTVFGEAAAILAGDGLLTQAFGLLSEEAMEGRWAPEAAVRVIWEIAMAAGPMGMVGGQALDMDGSKEGVDRDALELIHRTKTGALIRASVRVGGILGGGSEGALEALSRYAEAIGLAFQVADDILDVEGSRDDLGKDTQKDAARRKNTYPALLGLEGARETLLRLVSDAEESLAGFDGKADPLRGIARYIAERKR